MRTILLGLLLSSFAAATQVYAAQKSQTKASSAVTSEAVDALSTESQEDIEDRTVEEMTSIPVDSEAGVSAAPTSSTATSGPAEELLAGEMNLNDRNSTENQSEAAIQEAKTEAQIPVLTKAEVKNPSSVDPIGRLVISLGVVLAVAGGVYMFSRFWAKRRTGLTQHHQIKVLTQYGLGPKKSLAIIRVAGESILIGITDQNINMIKSLSLLDEELPIEVPTQFNHELSRHVGPQAIAAEILSASLRGQSGEKAEKVEKEEFSFGSVRDMVASKLREMRTL